MPPTSRDVGKFFFGCPLNNLEGKVPEVDSPVGIMLRCPVEPDRSFCGRFLFIVGASIVAERMAAADDALQAVGPQIGMPVSVACVSKNGIRSFWRQPPSARRGRGSGGRNRRNRPFEVGENLSDACFSGWPLSLFLFLVSSFEYRIAVVDDSIFGFGDGVTVGSTGSGKPENA